MPWQMRNRSADLPDDEPLANNPLADDLLWVEEILLEYEGIPSDGSGNGEATPDDGTLSEEEDLEALTEAQLNAMQAELEKRA
jgi:hypothetical protein